MLYNSGDLKGIQVCEKICQAGVTQRSRLWFAHVRYNHDRVVLSSIVVIESGNWASLARQGKAR